MKTFINGVVIKNIFPWNSSINYVSIDVHAYARDKSVLINIQKEKQEEKETQREGRQSTRYVGNCSNNKTLNLSL